MQYTGKVFLCFLLFQFLAPSIISQEPAWGNKDMIRMVYEADGYFIYDENFAAAADIYSRLIKQKPEDHNLNYKLGVCYLNITGKKNKSIPLLEYASENYVNEDYYNSLGETAPLDVLYYLAFANHINMNLDEAIDGYTKYKKLLRVKEASEIEFIDLQIKACQNAKEFVNINHLLKKELFTGWLSGFSNALYPVVSDNDSIFVFTIKGEEGNRIFLSNKSNGIWSEAEDITELLGKHRDMSTNSISGDGKNLIISRNDGIRGDIYVSHFEKGSWNKIKKLGKTVNTKYWESHACINTDGTILYFASNRPGGYGSLDIYSCSIDEGWKVGEAKNLGAVINTRFEENTPYFDAASSTLWFSSNGHEGFGGYDIFQSNFSKRWSQPVHIPYPLNTTSDDLNFVPINNNSGLVSVQVHDTSAYENIYIISVDIKPLRKFISINGELKLGDGLNIIPENMIIELVNTKDDSLIIIPVNENGIFSSSLTFGSYELFYNYPGYRSDTMNITIPESYEGNEMKISHSLTPDMVELGTYLAIRNILFEFDSSSLTREAMIELEKLIPVLLSHQDLKISVRGYTDAIGPQNYNIGLSGQRANTVVEYLVGEGIDSSRINSLAIGSSEYVSDNTNSDGSDNPEGRKYNRRVSVNIIDNGYALPVESYIDIPRHIRKKHSYSFFVIINESEKALPQGYFNKFARSEFAFIKEIESASRYYYAVGGFRTRTDALCYLLSLREEGFNNSYIINEYELPGESVFDSSEKIPLLYTIQIHALSAPSTTEFKGLANLKMIKGSDGLYRYTVGEYNGYSRAKQALDKIKAMGYKQAFIKALKLLESQSILPVE